MPCMCWYEPDEQIKKEFKNKCKDVVDVLHKVNKTGDALGMQLQDALTLIEHLYTGKCSEK